MNSALLKAALITFAVIVLVAVAYFFRPSSKSAPVNNLKVSIISPAPSDTPPAKISPALSPPLNRPKERVTKKRFGQFITPQNSPVQPERFRGFHTGADFETFPEEQSEAVQVKAVCSGKILRKGFVSGYGGLVVQQCQLESGPMTVVYGHLKLTSVLSNIGDNLHQGENLGLLGTGFTSETDGERKHLHLGLHRGTAIDLRGYVQTQEELSAWIDPCPLVCSE